LLLEGFLDLMKRGEAATWVELQMAFQDKPDDFNLWKVTALRELLESHRATDTTAAASVALELESARLEGQVFDLELEKIQNDAKRYRVWKQKCLDATS